jgi:hypothetical protein
MAYKYKLVKELERDTIGDIGEFIRSVTIQPGGIPLEAMRKIFVEIPGSSNPNDEISILDKGIRDILINDGGFDEQDVKKYIEYLYDLRKNTVTPSGIPINEKEKDFMDIASEKAQIGNLDTNPKQDAENADLGNTYMTDKERNMTPEEYRKYRKREELEEQGKAKLTQEVLRRLKNR